MPTRTLPTRDVTLADGRRLYYQQGQSRQHTEHGTPASVYMTKRGPNGALRILITVDNEPAHGEHYHLSGSYPDRTPTSDEMLAALKVLIPGGGQFGAVTPERNRHALHGPVVHLIEEYARSESPPVAGPTDDAATHATYLRMVRDDFALTPPFTTAALRDALDQVRARRSLPRGWLPPTHAPRNATRTS